MQLQAEAGRALVHVLSIDRRPVAVVLGFRIGNTYQCYQPTFDVSLAEYGPSHCLFAHCIEDCISQGLTRFDFLAGEHAYKTQYFDERRPVGRVVIMQPQGPARMQMGMELLRQGLKGSLKRLAGRA